MQGLIIENISNLFKVKIGKEIYEMSARGKIKKDEITPVVGDIVDVEITDKENLKGVIEKIEERKTYIKRPKISNISQILFVISTKNPKPDLLMLDKQLAYAEFLNIKPIIIINKIDLAETYKQIVEIYEKVGYTVIATNAKEKVGIEEIKKVLKNNISAFSGNSGVGKSTITNAIFNKEKTQEGEISKKNKRGKNTTTQVSLYELDENSYIADTPGFSNFDIHEIESSELQNYFIEFKDEIPNCEFIGCTHIKEQNCGIKKAIVENRITQDRYDRFCMIYNELKEMEERKKW